MISKASTSSVARRRIRSLRFTKSKSKLLRDLGKRDLQEKVKDRAKFAAAKEALKYKGKGDKDEPVAETPQKWRDYTVEFHFQEPLRLLHFSANRT